MSIGLTQVTSLGFLKAGDVVLIDDGKNTFPACVKEVINSKADGEEVILTKSSNKFFNVDMYLDGKSWVKNVMKIDNGIIYSLSNTTKGID